MWTYHQSTGALLDRTGKQVAIGYSGHAEGLNKPDYERVPDTGPIPHGRYGIGRPCTHPTVGPVAMYLIPAEGTDTFGRRGFLIHGDNQAVNHTASHGCIILPRPIRELIAQSGDYDLDVVP